MKAPFIVAVALIFVQAAPTAAATILITGASRGLGLEFVRQYAERGDEVIATARNPDEAPELRVLAAQNARITIEQLDVAAPTSIAALAARYRGRAIDVLINNAGLLGDVEAQQLGSLDVQEFQTLMMVNAYGPLAVSDAFRDHVASSRQKKIIAISSGNGSVSAERVPGGLYFYRSSKAALNILMRGLYSDLEGQGIVVGVISPGAVDTDMGRAAGGGDRLSPAVSVERMINVIDGLSRETNDKFYRYDGATRPW
ncbi:MAG: SDR family oxidoreductase [Rhodospirillaceae bacterium]|nr:SDR family oxidoreductase [Rhodospirillaceae bacterium]